MEEVEVEILEPMDTSYKEIPVLVGIKEEVDNSRQMIINGVPQVVVNYLVHCPKCGRVVYALNEPGTNMVIATQVCNANTKQLEEIAQYCPKCGQKLRYDFGEPIDLDITEVTTPVTNENI